jgi:hypothetical protein
MGVSNVDAILGNAQRCVSMLVVRDKLRFYRGSLRAPAGKCAEFLLRGSKDPGLKPLLLCASFQGPEVPAPSGFALSREGADAAAAFRMKGRNRVDVSGGGVCSPPLFGG